VSNVIAPEVRDAVIAAIRAGTTTRKIAAETGVSGNTVTAWRARIAADCSASATSRFTRVSAPASTRG
jgi:FixJ family two-component response regulator